MQSTLVPDLCQSVFALIVMSATDVPWARRRRPYRVLAGVSTLLLRTHTKERGTGEA